MTKKTIVKRAFNNIWINLGIVSLATMAVTGFTVAKLNPQAEGSQMLFNVIKDVTGVNPNSQNPSPK